MEHATSIFPPITFFLGSPPASVSLLSLAARLGLLLALSLGVDACSEGVLEAQGDLVHDQDERRECNTGRLAEPKSASDEAHGAAVVHGRIGHVEGEASNHVIHKDSKVVAEVGASDTECPHRGEHKNVAAGQERDG